MQVAFDPMSYPKFLFTFFSPHQTLVELASHPVLQRALLRLIETKSQLSNSTHFITSQHVLMLLHVA